MISRELIIAVLFASVVLAFLLGYISKEIELRELPLIEVTPSPTPPTPVLQPIEAPTLNLTRTLVVKLVAVDRFDKGAIAELIVGMAPGKGATWVRIDRLSPLINPDTQQSLRDAVEVVKRTLGLMLSDVDFYFGVIAESELVGGRSAGAAVAIATMAVIKNETLREDALITGTIEFGGRIGAVGKIEPKALAAREKGFRLLLVPPGESTTKVPKETCTEERFDAAIIRRCVTNFVDVPIAEQIGGGIEIREVSNILEAYNLMRKT